MTASTGSKRTRADIAAETRAAILDAACETIAEIGFEKIRMRMVAERAGAPASWTFGAFVISAIAGGWFAARSSILALAKFRFDVNLLMILAAIGAGVIGYVFEAAVLMFLFSLSNTLEVYTMGRTRRALHALLKLRPTRALVQRGGREIEVDVESVEVTHADRP